MSAAAPNMMPNRYRAEARFSAISCPRGTLASFCPDSSTAFPTLVVERQVHSRSRVCHGPCRRARAGSQFPHPTSESREIPWVGRSSSLAWGIEGQRTQFIMTLDEVDRLFHRTGHGQSNGGMHGGDGAEDWSQGHRFGDPRRAVPCRGRQRQHEVETSGSLYEPFAVRARTFPRSGG